MKKSLFLMLVFSGFTYAATVTQPFTEMDLHDQAVGVCGARDAIDAGASISRSAGVIKAYKDAVERDSNIKVIDGLKDGECTGETIKQYNSKPEYYASCDKNNLTGYITCSGK
ncbi:hypothetical protein F6Q07_05640 [Pectobacterium parmentieri]|uniref:hypothetical protein n=1 Tax=Pectobacterium parmentieri TaxID=1905730 RepID=UPI000EACBA9C|nr:hypothetical protein [Pectobacterium parmentieri]AYH00657.1 hypothetical protein C5E26_06715 [Pectobacterium parmentieri]AYH26894.1 hypothetical protein C5E20_06965 [Pectobacterium parmentieri]AYH31343.1 hypothetical protein C5E19_06735 [Pectobacterium parmentieri]MBI0517618.1 hypothetical protein [Pectobacterium parmentieri]QHQ16486.1 hypothetical protein GMW39_11830 [Pectobacterium parmentieri]